MLAACLCTVLFAISSVCGHRSAKLIGGVEANFWRLSLACLLVGVWSYGLGIGLSGVALGWLTVSGAIGIGLGDVALFQALPRLGPRVTSLLVQCLTAPLGALVEWKWLGTELTAAQMGSGLLIILGVGWTLYPSGERRFKSADFLEGISFAFVAAAGTAIGAVLSRKAYEVANLAGESLDGGTAAFQRIIAGTLVAGIAVLLVKRKTFRVQQSLPYDKIVEVSRRKWQGVWPWVVANGLMGQALGVSLMQWALKTTPAGVVMSIVSVTPVVIIPVAWVIDRERPTLQGVLGGLTAVGGVIGLALAK